MICPGCRTRVSDDAFVCEACNTVLDTSFLGEGITNAPEQPAEQSTRIGKMPEPQAAAKGAAPKVPAPATFDLPPEQLNAAASNVAKKKLSEFMDAAAAPPSAAEAMNDLVSKFKQLPVIDRVTLGGAAATLLSMVLPWHWTKERFDIIGLFTDAWACALFAVFIAAGVAFRRHPLAKPFRVPIMGANVFFSALSILIIAGFAQGAEKLKHIRNAPPIVEAQTQFGVYLGVLAVLVMLAGATWTIVKRNEFSD